MRSASAESQGPVSRPCQNFDSEICGVVSDAVWDSREKQQQILQMAIVEHLYQQGMLSVAEELCQVTTRGRVLEPACFAFYLIVSFILGLSYSFFFCHIQTSRFVYMTQMCCVIASHRLMGMPIPGD